MECQNLDAVGDSMDRESALCQLTQRKVCELAKHLDFSLVVRGGFANSSLRVPGSWQNLVWDCGGALCQLTQWKVCELAKQLQISTICQWRLCQLITPRAGELAKPTLA